MTEAPRWVYVCLSCDIGEHDWCDDRPSRIAEFGPDNDGGACLCALEDHRPPTGRDV